MVQTLTRYYNSELHKIIMNLTKTVNFTIFFIVMVTGNSKYSKICLFTKYLNQNKLGDGCLRK